MNNYTSKYGEKLVGYFNLPENRDIEVSPDYLRLLGYVHDLHYDPVVIARAIVACKTGLPDIDERPKDFRQKLADDIAFHEVQLPCSSGVDFNVLLSTSFLHRPSVESMALTNLHNTSGKKADLFDIHYNSILKRVLSRFSNKSQQDIINREFPKEGKSLIAVINKEYLLEILDEQVTKNNSAYKSGVFSQEDINWLRETFGARDEMRPEGMKYLNASDTQIQEDLKYFHRGMAQEYYTVRFNVQHRSLDREDLEAFKSELNTRVENLETLAALLVNKEIDTTNNRFFLQRKAQPEVSGRTDDEIIRIFYHEIRGRLKVMDNVIEMFTQ
jgi:hypothetical protein